MALSPIALTRSVTGLVLTFGTHSAISPAVYKYAVGYVVKENYPNKVWALCVQDEDTLIDSGILSDPDTIVLPAGWTMATVLSAGQASAANSALAQTDIGITVTAGQTVYQMIDAILVALNHSPGAVDTLIL